LHKSFKVAPTVKVFTNWVFTAQQYWVCW